MEASNAQPYTTWGSSGILKIGKRRDPNNYFITGQDPCLKERNLCQRGSLIALSHKRENAHINLKCSKVCIEER